MNRDLYDISEKELGDVDGVSRATMNWQEGKGISLEVEQAQPSKKALIDFRDSLLNNSNTESDIISGVKTTIYVEIGFEGMCRNKFVDRNLKNFGIEML